MLVQCWHMMCDAGPVSSRHWFSISCLLVSGLELVGIIREWFTSGKGERRGGGGALCRHITPDTVQIGAMLSQRL